MLHLNSISIWVQNAARWPQVENGSLQDLCILTSQNREKYRCLEQESNPQKQCSSDNPRKLISFANKRKTAQTVSSFVFRRTECRTWTQ